MNPKKAKLFGALIITAGSMFAASSASAADGLISFEGEITDQTCKINGGAGQNFTVTLPKVSRNSLATSGNWAGRTAFDIRLTDCTPNTGPVTVYFEPGPETDASTGRLNVDQATGVASRNVQVELLNSDTTSIKVGSAQHNSKPTNIVEGSATLNYYAQYYATGQSTSGPVKSRVSYTVIYP